MQYRAMRYASYMKQLDPRKKAKRAMGSQEVRTQEKRMVQRQIEEELDCSQHVFNRKAGQDDCP